ncbi:hypothetical protein [Tropicimonas isoalkanivorans]|uniref:Uncharacterized protein n=1 Tax=Tropicimonas isoalkanivorans TaxID=441112 RepID=A0A1I1JD25_9RHOB|nr:hypothetical protein [Tropicimonas isoalkanivorans]SFC46051.1 hypothetical protein SAMN04488094_10557 [Tropicimonas isoalkanivorans]
MAIAADQGFTKRIARIEAGKQWTPEGVIVPKRGKRRKADINRGSRRMSFFLALVLVSGTWIAFSSHDPELANQVASDGADFVVMAVRTVADL